MAAAGGKNLNQLEAVNWGVFPALENWDRVDDPHKSKLLRDGFRPSKWICDEEAPRHLMVGFLDKLTTAWTEQQPFERDTDREEMELVMEEATVRSWKGKRARLEKWQCIDEGAVVLFGVGSLGLAIGECQGHPFIHCNSFSYINSDGSYEAKVPDTGRAQDVFDWVMREFEGMCADRHH